jgi:hypothetical protein
MTDPFVGSPNLTAGPGLLGAFVGQTNRVGLDPLTKVQVENASKPATRLSERSRIGISMHEALAYAYFKL